MIKRIETMRKFFLILTGLLVQICVQKASAQTVAKNLDTYYRGLSQNQEMNGNVAASENGEAIYQQSFGYRDLAAQKLNDQNTQFELASVSKLFTAVAVLQLKDRGLVNLDTPFQHYFPE